MKFRREIGGVVKFHRGGVVEGTWWGRGGVAGGRGGEAVSFGCSRALARAVLGLWVA